MPEKPKEYKRITSAKLPKRNWIQRNPRLFQITFITTSLVAFFSKPLYDLFFAERLPHPRQFEIDQKFKRS